MDIVAILKISRIEWGQIMTSTNNAPRITDFFTRYKECAWEKDLGGMAELYADDISVFDLWETPQASGITEWKNTIGNWFSTLGADRDRVDFSEIEITQEGGLAVARAYVRYAAVSASGEELRHMKNRITLSFTRTADRWIVTHQHTSAPISAVNLGARLDF